MLAPSSKTDHIFINDSISTIQSHYAAADALSSGQEKDARAYFIRPCKILPHHPNGVSATLLIFRES